MNRRDNKKGGSLIKSSSRRKILVFLLITLFVGLICHAIIRFFWKENGGNTEETQTAFVTVCYLLFIKLDCYCLFMFETVSSCIL